MDGSIFMHDDDLTLLDGSTHQIVCMNVRSLGFRYAAKPVARKNKRVVDLVAGFLLLAGSFSK